VIVAWLFEPKSGIRMSEPPPIPQVEEQDEAESPAPPPANADEPGPPTGGSDSPGALRSQSRTSRTQDRRVHEKPRADRNREKAELLNVDYEALHQQSVATATQIYAKLLEARAPLLRENAVICEDAAPIPPSNP
jgi:hypothetical protein